MKREKMNFTTIWGLQKTELEVLRFKENLFAYCVVSNFLFCSLSKMNFRIVPLIR